MGPDYSLHLMGSKKTNGKKWKGRQKRTGPTFKKHYIRAQSSERPSPLDPLQKIILLQGNNNHITEGEPDWLLTCQKLHS